MSLIRFLSLSSLVFLVAPACADEPLHKQIDQHIKAKAAGKPISPPTDDAEFLRRVSLDFQGRIPSATEIREFLADKSPDKRAKRIDQLVNGPDYPKRMADQFHIMLMERMGENPKWTEYLLKAFTENRPWDRIAHEILKADRENEATLGAAFFIAKRLDKVGQETTDFAGLTRDVGRIFLGKNLQCAQCHDHLFIDDYKQEHFQGIFAYIQNVYIIDVKAPSVGEKATTEKVAFMSVFKKINRMTGPALPGEKETEPPVFKKGEEYTIAPNPKTKTPGVPKFSTLSLLAEQAANPANKDFARNIANRLWFIMMGRGIVHPLDLHHSDNPPSHPELLDLLAKEFVTHKFDIKWFLREVALSETYQRSSLLPEGETKSAPELFLTAVERRLSADQLLWSTLEAVGEREYLLKNPKPVEGAKVDLLTDTRAKFTQAFANAAREPEEEFTPSLRGTLFLLNSALVQNSFTPRFGNLVERLSKMTDDDKTVDELYLSILTRLPSQQEKDLALKHLKKRADQRTVALGQFAWALLASIEFSVNH